jgi:hypothetical protein
MASKAATPELKKYMDKRVFIQLNGNRKVTGVLRGMECLVGHARMTVDPDDEHLATAHWTLDFLAIIAF